jgi:beta-acetyl hexosaminidase like
MFYSLFVAAWLYLLLLSSVAGGRSPLWPQPSIAELGDDVVWVDRAMTATLYCSIAEAVEPIFQVHSPGTVGHYKEAVKQIALTSSQFVRRVLRKGNQPSPTSYPPASIPEQDIVREAIRRTVADIHTSKFVPWKFHKRGSNFEPEHGNMENRLTELGIKQLICPMRLTDPLSYHAGDESYKIKLDHGSAWIETVSSIGTLRALGKSSENLSSTHPPTYLALSC